MFSPAILEANLQLFFLLLSFRFGVTRCCFSKSSWKIDVFPYLGHTHSSNRKKSYHTLKISKFSFKNRQCKCCRTRKSGSILSNRKWMLLLSKSESLLYFEPCVWRNVHFFPKKWLPVTRHSNLGLAGHYCLCAKVGLSQKSLFFDQTIDPKKG